MASQKSNLWSYVLLVLAMAFWGLSWPVSKSLVAGKSPFIVGFLRFFVATMVYLPILIITKRKELREYKVNTYFKFFKLGLLGIFGYGILFLFGMQLTTASQGSVLAGIQPVLITSLAWIFFKEKLESKWQYIGFTFSLLGVIVIIGIQSFLEYNQEYLIGNILVIIALCLFASYSIYGKKVMQTISSLESTIGATFFGMLMFGIGAIIENEWNQLLDVDINFWIGILTLAIGTTVIGFFFYFYAIQKIGATKTGVFINLVPVFGTTFSVIILKETLSWTLLLGLICVSIGILIINFPKKQIISDELLIQLENDEK